MAEKRITTTTAKITLGEDGIVRIRVLLGTRETIATAQENSAAFRDLCGKKQHPVLIDMAGALWAPQEVRRFYSDMSLSSPVAAAALIVPNPVSRVIGSFYLGFNKPRHPVKLFTSETPAIEWLKNFKE